MKYLFVDIRKSDEVYTKRFENSKDYSVYNIPMNMIRFNKKNISDHLEYNDEIYIVCSSSNRANFIKDKYFSEFNNIKVIEGLQFENLEIGENIVTLNDKNINIKVEGTGSFNLYSIMRIIQIILGSLILILGGYTYSKLNKNFNKTPLIILLLFGLMSLINGLTSTCTMSEILKDQLN